MFAFIVPFQWLPPAAAGALWLALDLLAPWLALWLTFKALRVPGLALPGVGAALLFMSMPLWENNAREILHWQMLLCAGLLLAVARSPPGVGGRQLWYPFEYCRTP